MAASNRLLWIGDEAHSIREKFAEFKDRSLGLLSILSFKANNIMIHHHERTLILLEDIKEKQEESSRKREDEVRNNKKHPMKLKRMLKSSRYPRMCRALHFLRNIGMGSPTGDVAASSSRSRVVLHLQRLQAARPGHIPFR